MHAKPKFKIDENISPSTKALFISAGFDVATTEEQGLNGASDKKIADVCKKEGRCLVTTDLDFAQIVNFPPEQYCGIVVLHHPERSLSNLSHLISQLIMAVKTASPRGKLWIVEPGRIRIHIGQK